MMNKLKQFLNDINTNKPINYNKLSTDNKLKIQKILFEIYGSKIKISKKDAEYIRKSFVSKQVAVILTLILSYNNRWYVSSQNITNDFIKYIFTNSINKTVSANLIINYPVKLSYKILIAALFVLTNKERIVLLHYVIDNYDNYDTDFIMDFVYNMHINDFITRDEAEKYVIESLPIYFCLNIICQLSESNTILFLSNLMSRKYNIYEKVCIEFMREYIIIPYEIYPELCKEIPEIIRILAKNEEIFYNDICDTFVTNNKDDDKYTLKYLIYDGYYINKNTYHLAMMAGNKKCAKLIKKYL
jgi:hypothetical protein